MTSPIDHYYEVLDYINELEKELNRESRLSTLGRYTKIDNKHKLSGHLHQLLLLAKEAEREYWESIGVRVDED
jgi:hypothetical protein